MLLLSASYSRLCPYFLLRPAASGGGNVAEVDAVDADTW